MRSDGSRSSAFRFFVLIGLVFLGLVTLGAATSSRSPSASIPSPSSGVDLICHTDSPEDCYPRIFQPTDEFQTVHEDQDLPPGLHVRLNVWTGQKEAKINVPDEQDDALAGLPVDSSVVVIDQPESAEQVRIPAGAPAYDSVGKIKKPTDESNAFYDSLKFVKKGLDFDDALESIEELSHDIYYGLKIAEDYKTIESLFCLANDPKIFEAGVDESVLNRARLAALTISGAVQNHAKSLSAVEKHWGTLKTTKCLASPTALGRSTFQLVAPTASENPTNDPTVAKARASVIRGLVKSPVIRKDFLDQGGMSSLLEVLVSRSTPEWEPVQKKVALLVQDNFLDESMGASLGHWPRDDQAADDWCENHDGVSEKCWDWEVERLVQRHGSDKSHWSVELSRWLTEARRAVEPRSRDRVEL